MNTNLGKHNRRNKSRLTGFSNSKAAMMDLGPNRTLVRGLLINISSDGMFLATNQTGIAPKAIVVVFVKLVKDGWVRPTIFRVLGEIKRINWRVIKKTNKSMGYAIKFIGLFEKVDPEMLK